MSFEDACYLFVNPMSAYLMWKIVEHDHHVGVIHTAASSSLGHMLYRLCRRKGMPVINVVRRPEQLQAFEAMGAVFTVCQADPDFEPKLKAAIEKVQPSVCFDAVVGDLAGTLFPLMPAYAHYYVYGMLSGKPIPSVSIEDTLMYQKQLRGFWLSEDLYKLPREQVIEGLDYISADIVAEHSCFRQNIVRQCPLEDFTQVLHDYSRIASQGKIIFKPNQ